MFATGPSINTRFLAVVLVSLTLLVLDHQSTRLVNLRAGLSFLVYPIIYAVDLPSKFISRTADSVFSYAELLSENKRLKEQQFISDSKLLKFAALEKENIRLRTLLDSSYKIGEQMLVAEILSVNFAPYDHVVQVNKGSHFGLHDKQPVFDTQGVIGQVVRTLPLTSEIMLITDPNHAIPVQVNRNGLRTVAVGSGQLNRLTLPFLPHNADIKPGDLLITSGLGGIFPQGYPVATVSSVEAQPHKQFALVTATPKASLDKIREVLIVWSDSKSVPLSVSPAVPHIAGEIKPQETAASLPSQSENDPAKNSEASSKLASESSAATLAADAKINQSNTQVLDAKTFTPSEEGPVTEIHPEPAVSDEAADDQAKTALDRILDDSTDQDVSKVENNSSEKATSSAAEIGKNLEKLQNQDGRAPVKQRVPIEDEEE